MSELDRRRRCPDYEQVALAVMAGDGSPHCEICAPRFEHIARLDAIFRRNPETFARTTAPARPPNGRIHLFPTPRAARAWLGAALLLLAIFGASLARWVVPIGHVDVVWRGQPIRVLSATVESGDPGVVAIQWTRIVAADRYVARIWTQTGQLVAEREATGSSALLEVRGVGSEFVLWAVDAWAGEEKVASSGVREFALGPGDR